MMKGLRYIFPSTAKKMDADQMFEKVQHCHKNGNLEEASKLCSILVSEYPYNVYYRKELVLLQSTLGQEISLPDITPRSIQKPKW